MAIFAGCSTTHVDSSRMEKGSFLHTEKGDPISQGDTYKVNLRKNRVKLDKKTQYSQTRTKHFAKVKRERIETETYKPSAAIIIALPAQPFCWAGSILVMDNPASCLELLYEKEMDWRVKRSRVPGQTFTESKEVSFSKWYPGSNNKVSLYLNQEKLANLRTNDEGVAKFDLIKLLSSRSLPPGTLLKGKEATLMAASRGARDTLSLSHDYFDGLPREYWIAHYKAQKSVLAKKELIHTTCGKAAESTREYFRCYYRSKTVQTAFGPGELHAPPGKGSSAVGPKAIEWRDGRTFSGKTVRGDNGQPALVGEVTYPDGRRFVGDVLNDNSDGTLYSPSGDILFSGKFKNGRPTGWGTGETESGSLKPVKFADGEKVSNPARKEAEKAVETEHQRAMEATQEKVEELEEETATQEAEKKKLASAFSDWKRHNSKMWEKCACEIPMDMGGQFCLSANPTFESAEEREAHERAAERRHRVCMEWARSDRRDKGDYYEKRMAQVDRDLDRKLEQIEEERRLAEIRRERLRRKHERQRQAKIRARKAEIKAQREKRLAEKKRNCQASYARTGAVVCGCQPFLDVGDVATCMK
ncbi:hypothetical protein [Thiohalorhabdus methylotrophus]|uniref:MORN repeat protein n=1 Tax=Thiohalorhabdus methylotrophus TaxID=3242694 RepID=A0ABV4U0S6_9GAMM